VLRGRCWRGQPVYICVIEAGSGVRFDDVCGWWGGGRRCVLCVWVCAVHCTLVGGGGGPAVVLTVGWGSNLKASSDRQQRRAPCVAMTCLSWILSCMAKKQSSRLPSVFALEGFGERPTITGGTCLAF
jgi:hypothetical protein